MCSFRAPAPGSGFWTNRAGARPGAIWSRVFHPAAPSSVPRFSSMLIAVSMVVGVGAAGMAGFPFRAGGGGPGAAGGGGGVPGRDAADAAVEQGRPDGAEAVAAAGAPGGDV